GEKAVSGPGTYVASSEDSHLWEGLAPGRHNLSIQLVNNDHTPLEPAVTDRVSIYVATGPKPPASVPGAGTGETVDPVEAVEAQEAQEAGNAGEEQENETATEMAMEEKVGAETGGLAAGAAAAQNLGQEEPGTDASPANASRNVTVDLVALGMSFNKKTIAVPAGAHVVVNFYNRDSGIPHNFAVYDTPSMGMDIFVGQLIFGPKQIVYEFDAPREQGIYHFQCDPHANVMKGDFVVQ
ncbi:MAG: hypothetical protein GKC10_03945, partial [Methanosarcinales archaeon]|nr:hypothetical protein [Methanosarcinales archaeon]